jgi:DNA primase
MAFYTQDILDDIKARLPLSEVIAKKVTWDRRKSQPARGNFWACCPFHQEKTPSFHVDDHKSLYYCFGCGASGDHIKFVCDTEGLDFPEAVERLAADAGVKLPAKTAHNIEKAQVQKSLYDVVEAAAVFFQNSLVSAAGRDALIYADGRGLNAAVRNLFQIGFAPDGRDTLKKYLLQKGYDEKSLINAGLIIKPDDGRPSYDRFRGRLMVPIHDLKGRIVAFGGRVLKDDQEPKYLNSPETDIFSKGRLLFNAHRAREEGFQKRSIIVVEGYMDVIALWKAGIHNCVASLGTAFTEDQLRLLWRICPEPILCFDGDNAGARAANRAMERALPILRAEHSLKISLLPSGKDPDDIVMQQGADAFYALLAQARPMSDMLWLRELEASRLATPEHLAAFQARLDTLSSTIKDENTRYFYKQFFKQKFKDHQYQSTKYKSSAAKQFGRQALHSDKISLVLDDFKREKIILGLAACFPEIFIEDCERLEGVSFSHEEMMSIATDVCAFFHTQDDYEASKLKLPSSLMKRISKILGGLQEIIIENKAYTIFEIILEFLPTLRLSVDPDYLKSIYDVHILTLELKQLKKQQTILDGVQDIENNDDIMQRIMDINKDIAQQTALLDEKIHQLDDLDKQLRHSKGLVSTI